MSVLSPLVLLLLMLWLAALFFAVWAIIIGRREDRLAKIVGKLYGALAMAIQLPLFAAWLGFLGRAYNDPGVVDCIIGGVPTLLALIALVLSFRLPVEGNPNGRVK